MADVTFTSVSLPPGTFYAAWNGNGHIVIPGSGFTLVLPEDTGNNSVHALDRHQAGLWVLVSDATNLTMNPWRLNGSAQWAAGSNVAAGTGKSPSLWPLRNGGLSAAYVDGGSAKRAVWKPGATSFSHVQTVGTATLVDHCIDPTGRCIVAAYNSGWVVYVGEPAATAWTYTFTGPVSMGLTSLARRGCMIPMPGGGLAFAHVTTGDSVQVYRTRSLSKAGVGSWSLLATIGSGKRVTMAFDKAGRLIVARYNAGAWHVSVGTNNAGTWTFGATVAMGITETERGAHLLALPAELSFMHAGTTRKKNRGLSQAAVGTWS